MHSHTLAWIVPFLFLGFIDPDPVEAQQLPVRHDPASGDYFITVYNDDLEPIEARVVPASKVEVSVSPTLSILPAGGIRYSYTVRVPIASPQGLMSVDLPCPAIGQLRNLTAVVQESTGPDTLFATAGGGYCSVMLGAIPLDPGGDTLVVSFEETRLLAGIGEVRMTGAGSGLQLPGGWPTSDPIPENDAARDFVWSVSGTTGGWKTVQTIVPAREPSALDDPTQGLALIRSDLERVCGELGWISNHGICRSLQVKLEHAARSLERGRAEAARGQLQSFLSQLEAQHGPQPGKHVNDNAYALLSTNAEYVLTRF